MGRPSFYSLKPQGRLHWLPSRLVRLPGPAEKTGHLTQGHSRKEKKKELLSFIFLKSRPFPALKSVPAVQAAHSPG